MCVSEVNCNFSPQISVSISAVLPFWSLHEVKVTLVGCFLRLALRASAARETGSELAGPCSGPSGLNLSNLFRNEDLVFVFQEVGLVLCCVLLAAAAAGAGICPRDGMGWGRALSPLSDRGKNK